MRAAVAYEANAPVVFEDVELASPGPREVLVRLMASGVCHSDWHILKGEAGDHVIIAWRTSCGLCEMCQKGWPVVCDRSPGVRERPRLRGSDRTVGLAGGLGTFAEYALVHEVAAVKIDEDIPFEQAALVGCGVATGGGGG